MVLHLVFKTSKIKSQILHGYVVHVSGIKTYMCIQYEVQITYNLFEIQYTTKLYVNTRSWMKDWSIAYTVQANIQGMQMDVGVNIYTYLKLG